MRKKRQRLRCTICGKICPMTFDGHSQWGHHMYGVLSEPRCSQECAIKPIVDTYTQNVIEWMGDVVVRARVAGISVHRATSDERVKALLSLFGDHG